MFLNEQINSKKGANKFQLNPLNQECQKGDFNYEKCAFLSEIQVFNYKYIY